ncbi:hypothetical protein AABD41_01450 [Staphylococcus pseudoxylosus]|uniref:hypothetical protein n=1 Tax=Staphylococcus pseudoxylosus TaxID=2282419 RepID=UPI00398A89D6
MANVNMYNIEVIGEAEKVKIFVEYMKGFRDKQLCGVYSDEVFYMYYNSKHIVNGSCRNSVYTSMLGEKGSYYNMLTEEDKTEFTTLELLSVLLNLKFEIEGKTDVIGEKERIIVENGQFSVGQ